MKPKTRFEPSTTNPALSLLLLLLLVASAAPAAAVAASPLPTAEICEEDLVTISPCLPYVAAPPNIPTPAPSAACCEAVAVVRAASCLCYVVRDPSLLGFPINATRVAALFSSCSGSRGRSAAAAFIDALSFVKDCRALKALPPLHNSTPARSNTAPSQSPTPGRNNAAPSQSLTPGSNAAPSQSPTAGRNKAAPSQSPTPGRYNAAPSQSPTPGRNKTTPLQSPSPGRNNSTPPASLPPNQSSGSPSVHKSGPAPQPRPGPAEGPSNKNVPARAVKFCCARNLLLFVGVVHFLLSTFY